MQLPLSFRSNPGAFKYLGGPTVINGYAQVGGEDQKTVAALLPHKGLTAFGLETGGPCRGGFYLNEDDALYSVNGGQLYKHISDGTWVAVQAIGGSGPVRFERNDAPTPQVIIHTSAAPFVLSGGTLGYLAYDFSPIDVVFLKGRFIYPLVDGKFWWTGINSTDVDGLAFATAEADPDGLVGAAALDDLYLIGTETTEIWSPTSDTALPFQPVGGTYLRIGCAAKDTIKKFNNALAWVGHDHVVYAVKGYTEIPISNHEITELIKADPDIPAIRAFTYEVGKNKFYVLKGTDWCREYNAETGYWVNRESGIGGAWRAEQSFSAFGQTIFGDALTGKLFTSSGYLEDGNEMIWGYDTPIIHSTPNSLEFNRIQFDLMGGVGDNTTTDPKVMISWSDDKGNSWPIERWFDLGAKGKHNARIVSRRMGTCNVQGRIYRARISDPVGRSLSSIDVDATKVVAG